MASFVANVNAPLALTLRSSPPLSCNTTVPDSPDTVPPIEYVLVVHVTVMFVTFAEPTVPAAVGDAAGLAARGWS